MKRKPSRGPREMALDAAVGARLRSARQLAGMSQTDLALRVGVSFQQVQKYEKGMNRIGASRLQQFAEILNVSVAFFFEPEDAFVAPRSLAAEQDNGARQTVFAGLPGQSGTGQSGAGQSGSDRAAMEGGASARETMELLRQFGLIRDPMVRRAFIDLLRQVNIQNGAQPAIPAPRPAETPQPVVQSAE